LGLLAVVEGKSRNYESKGSEMRDINPGKAWERTKADREASQKPAFRSFAGLRFAGIAENKTNLQRKSL